MNVIFVAGECTCVCMWLLVHEYLWLNVREIKILQRQAPQYVYTNEHCQNRIEYLDKLRRA